MFEKLYFITAIILFLLHKHIRRPVSHLASHNMHALAPNRQLSERHTGNKAYKQQQWAAALQHYQRALAVVNFVVGRSADEQAEVTANKAAVLLNIAAVHMAQQVRRRAVML